MKKTFFILYVWKIQVFHVLLLSKKTAMARKKEGKPFVIANPIYDTVFKRLMENQRIAKFFLSTILEQQVEDITVMPQEFTYRLDETKVLEKAKVVEEKEKEGHVEYFSIFRLDFMATILDSEGVRRKILIELQKSWDTLDVIRFRQYLGEQYVRVDKIDGKEVVLPITTIYILGNNLSEIKCPCVKVGRTYTDMLNKKTINTKSKFIENLTHNSYVIQAGRITDVRYTTNLDKLLSIFEQRYFVKEGSGARKEYPYQPDDEDMTLITDLLYEMGADPKEQKQIEDEEEALRVYNLQHGTLKKKLEEKEKMIEEKDKRIAELDKRIAELERFLRDKQVE
jgi:Tfp pilus assembly protein PilP